MSAVRTNPRTKALVSWSKEHRASKSSSVLADRNQVVVAVGAWVEDGHDFQEHPSVLALKTEALQAEKRRENEDGIRRFQDTVRRRLAQRAQVCNKRPQPHARSVVTPGRRIPRYHARTTHRSAGEKHVSAGRVLQQRMNSPESSEEMRQVRLRLAACRLIQDEQTASELPGGRWNISPSRHRAECGEVRIEEDGLGEEEEEDRGVHLLSSQHECPLVQQKVRGHALWNPTKSHAEHGSKSGLGAPQVLWPLTDKDKLIKQRQSQFLMHRRLVMNLEREHVKENKQHRKHLRRTAGIKAEKEQIRLEEERRLERAEQLAEARQKLQDRELLILERLKLEEDDRAGQLQRTKREERWKEVARFVEALRAQMKERLSQAKVELPPLCCCASSFWDSHPDTCANNCVFHNNPKAYVQALHSAMGSLDLQ
ncbi:coiled-coil domain-containing protein 15 isoform X2 [Melanotaenia boesemani]|uniref:coiled-coil domain-containing protein 15 isoform X2 n=1 Tax=Melanotaenia boesemani TaxID=1250792 RepID=UPI001C0562CF|nr:coiled-coil domain-containing protein 15 isoform X2 [Melanotaenia boesemani]